MGTLGNEPGVRAASGAAAADGGAPWLAGVDPPRLLTPRESTGCELESCSFGMATPPLPLRPGDGETKGDAPAGERPSMAACARGLSPQALSLTRARTSQSKNSHSETHFAKEGIEAAVVKRFLF